MKQHYYTIDQKHNGSWAKVDRFKSTSLHRAQTIAAKRWDEGRYGPNGEELIVFEEYSYRFLYVNRTRAVAA